MWGYTREFNGDIEEEFAAVTDLAEQYGLEEQVHDVKVLDGDGVMHRSDDIDAMTDQYDDDQFRAVAVEYGDMFRSVRLEYDHGTIIHEPFKLYVDGDEQWRDDVTAATDVVATETKTKQFLDLMTL